MDDATNKYAYPTIVACKHTKNVWKWCNTLGGGLYLEISRSEFTGVLYFEIFAAGFATMILHRYLYSVLMDD